MYLIDINIISELRKGEKANLGVQQFFNTTSQNSNPLYISSITIGELRKGVDLIYHRGDMSQGKLLENWLNGIINEYQNHILSA